eukprot:jgi/Chrzof1/2772/Cz11g28200.t1
MLLPNPAVAANDKAGACLVHVGKYVTIHIYDYTDFGAATASATAYQPYLTQHACWSRVPAMLDGVDWQP